MIMVVQPLHTRETSIGSFRHHRPHQEDYTIDTDVEFDANDNDEQGS